MTRLLDWLPRGNTLDEASFRRRHRLLQWILAAHVPVLFLFGWLLDNPLGLVLGAGIAPVVVLLLVGHFVNAKRVAASCISAGLVWCSITLVAVTHGTIESHFHFFIIIGFIALYQDWVPFLWNILLTGVSHGIGTLFWPTLIFNHPAAQRDPWLWAGIHAGAVLFACVGMVIFWRITEDEQHEKEELGRELVRADAEIGRRQFTSDMLVNLARRNQSMLYRQLDIINQLEEKEQDPDALSELFKLDHLATRVRRNAESLLVLSGEQPPRVWSAPVSMRDVVRAAIAETEDLERVEFSVDDRIAVAGHSVADLTHLLAELTENAVRFSPPDTAVTIRSRPQRAEIGGQVLTIEDWGVGMPADELAAANEMLIRPRDVDLSVSQRLGFHVVARLAARHGIEVSLSTTPGSGLTAVVILPAALFVSDPQAGPHAGIGSGPEQTRRATAVHEQPPAEHAQRAQATATVERSPLPGLAAATAPAWTPPSSPSPSPAAPATRSTPARPAPAARRGAPTPSVSSPATPAALPVSRPTPIPAAQGGNWSGWWDPAPADRVPGSPGDDAGRNGNGHATNGHDGPNGLGVPGGGPNGSGRHGNGPNGSAHAGSAHAGSAHTGNGLGGNGLGTNGLSGNGHNGNGHNGNGHNGSGRNGHALLGGDGAAFPGGPATIGSTGVNGIDGHTGNGHADGSGPDRHATDRPARTDGTARADGPVGRTGDAEAPDATRVPIPTPRPAPAESSRPPATGSSGLRRRVPQASLAPELRGGSAEPAAPAAPAAPATPSADAAHALSRYQASRQAAQAVADQAPDGSHDHHVTDRRTNP
ncbi:ATP-binding protein [Pseudonocardia kujensis]|uniref:sensor histidine kinase n=1 Tax=Pseudonocardia kujensis TaxID=1128675 RepID=UPI001E32C39B|nr:ATP-binding protein [Pseudonocardia kujensis]MCE0766672.1 ATP-binding protein [Pseudonocardia kujensis]